MLIALMLLAVAVDSPEMTRCLNNGDAARGVTSAMIDCTHREWTRRDAELNDSYRKAIARSGARRAELVRMERAWLTRRNAACQPHLRPDQGSLGGLDYEMCMVDQTVARTVWLRRWR